ncbi:MAG: hypothetical protein CM1200mP38_5330 [Dehalococcoidia bacterium]|nr:MAG: hypothetical protein CM1200mP38_5330 [Dehalococcoidia bacterium]
MAKISFIGGGVMAEAIISRVLSENLIDANNIYVGETYEQAPSNLGKKYLVRQQITISKPSRILT